MLADSLVSRHLAKIPVSMQEEVEVLMVNMLKLRMIRKLETHLTREGQDKVWNVFLVPIYSLRDLTEYIEIRAPELKTIYYKELHKVVSETEKRFS